MTRTLLLLALLAPSVQADESDDAMAKQLVAVVRDPRLATGQRAEAAKSLSKLGAKAAAATDELRTQLTLLKKSEQEPLQEAVLDALGAIGPAAKPVLPTLAKTTGRSTDIDLAVKDATNRILVDAASRNVADLVRQLKSRDDGTRLRAAKTLGGLEGNATSAIPELTASLTDADADVRRAVMSAIRKIQPAAKPSKELIQAYIAELKDADDNVRLSAVRTLAKFGRDAVDATAALQALASDPDRDVRRAAGEAIAKISAP